MRIALNKIVKVLILSDLVLLSGFGLISPIFAVFLTDRIKGGNMEVAGYAAAVYFIINSLVILPIARYLDRNHGEKDDLAFVVVGNLLAIFVVIGYIFARYPWHIYVLQVIYAVGMGMNAPGYNAIFTRHIDKGREAFDWSVRSALIGLGAGGAGAIGGVVATRFGFNTLFIGVAVFIFISALIPLLIVHNVSPRNVKIARGDTIKKV